MDPISIAIFGASIAKTIFGFFGADEENAALDREKLEAEVAANDQTIQRQQNLKKMVGAQIAASAASGISASSASLQVVQIDTFNKAAQDQDFANLELDIEKENIAQKQRNNTEKAWVGAFDNMFKAATFFGGLPATGKKPPEKWQVFGPSSSLVGTFREKAPTGWGVQTSLGGTFREKAATGWGVQV